MQQSEHDEPAVWQLADGKQLRIDDQIIYVESTRPVTTLQTRVDEISGVSRGGCEMILTRRESDPIIVQVRTLAAARALEQALVSRLAIQSHRARHWDPEGRV